MLHAGDGNRVRGDAHVGRDFGCIRRRLPRRGDLCWVPALWQERFGSDAIAGIVGLMAGSYVYAETSDYLGTTIQKIGNRGRIMLPDLISMRITVFLVIFVPLLVSSLFLLQRLAP